MCDFCKDIKRISYGEEIECTEIGFAREKLFCAISTINFAFMGSINIIMRTMHITETWISITALCAVERWWKNETRIAYLRQVRGNNRTCSRKW